MAGVFVCGSRLAPLRGPQQTETFMPTAFASYPSLDGMPVLISGGASGIGETLVREFARQGSKVGFVDIAAEAGEKLASELSAEGHTARFTRCDITDTAAYQQAIAGFAAAHGPA